MESLAAAIATNISKNGGDPGRFADPKTLREEARILGRLEEDADYSAERAVKDFDLEMTANLRAWNERRTGDPEALLEDLDEGEVKSIELSFGKQYSNGTFLRLELGKDGSQAELGGPVDWVSSAAGQLKVELKRQSSWLGHLLGLWGQMLVYLLTVLLLGLLIAPYFKSILELMVALVGCGIFVSVALTLLVQKLIPRFELRKDGKPKVKVWVGWLAGLLGTVVIGVVTNALSKLIGF
ncbi:hypothetical protein AB4Y88_00250 [Paenarthrobacter sp. RAF9]